VLVDGDDVDVRGAKGFEDTLQLRFEHGEVAVRHRILVAAREGGPGVDTHSVTHGLAIHLRFATEGDLVDAVLEIALAAKHGIDL
jgi:hypothetical protein